MNEKKNNHGYFQLETWTRWIFGPNISYKMCCWCEQTKLQSEEGAARADKSIISIPLVVIGNILRNAQCQR